MGIALNPANWARYQQPPAYTLPTLPPGTPQIPSSPAPTPSSYTGTGGIRTDIANAMPPPSGMAPMPGGGIRQQLPPGVQAPPKIPGAAPVHNVRRTIGDILAQVMNRGG